MKQKINQKVPARTVNVSLAAWGISPSPKFYSPDGVVVAALLANAAAKLLCEYDWEAQQDFYAMKSTLVEYAASVHPLGWRRDGIVYFETSVGQLSFHVFNGEGDCLQELNREWRGGWMQDNAKAIAMAFANENDHYLDFECDRYLRNFQNL